MNKTEINVLVVDDEEVMRSLFTDLLSEHGLKVSVAHHGKEAMELVKDKFIQTEKEILQKENIKNCNKIMFGLLDKMS